MVNGAGGLLQNGGSVTMAGADVTALVTPSGSGGFGFLFNNGGAASTLRYSNGTIVASNASLSVQGRDSRHQSQQCDRDREQQHPARNSRPQAAPCSMPRRSTLQGVIFTQTGSTSAVNLTQGTVWTLTGNSNATSVTNDASQIIYTPPTGDPTAPRELQDADRDEHGRRRLNILAQHISRRRRLAF